MLAGWLINAHAAPPPAATADLIDTVGDIVTINDEQPKARALAVNAVKDGKIRTVGERNALKSRHKGAKTKVVDSEFPVRRGRSLVDLAKELERQLENKKDRVVRSSLMRYRTSEQGASSVDIDEHAGVRTCGVTERAWRELADKMKIPTSAQACFGT